MSGFKLGPGPAGAVLHECRSPPATPSPQEPWPCLLITALCLIPAVLTGPDPDKQPWADFSWCDHGPALCRGPRLLAEPDGPPQAVLPGPGEAPALGYFRPRGEASLGGQEAPIQPGLGLGAPWSAWFPVLPPVPAKGCPHTDTRPAPRAAPGTPPCPLSPHRPPAAPQPPPTAPCGRAG